MKKFTLLIASLFITIGAMAQPQVGKYYKIKGNHSTNPWLTAVAEGGGIDVASDEVNAGIYEVTATGIRELITGKYIGTGGNGQQITLVSTADATTIEASDNGEYLIKTGGRYLYNNQADYTRESGSLTATGNANDPKWEFIEVAPLFTIDNEFNGRGTLAYGTYNNSEYFALTDITLSGCTQNNITMAKDANKYWYIARTNNGLCFYNIGNGCFMQRYASATTTFSVEKADGFSAEIRTKDGKNYVSIKDNSYYLSYSCGWAPGVTGGDGDATGPIRWYNNDEEAATLLTLNEVANAATDYASEIATAKAILNGFDLTVTDAGYATLYLGYPAEIPTFDGEDNGVYIATGSLSEGYLHLEPVTGVLPANTGVIVKANQGEYEFVYSTETPADVSNNLLKGSVTEEYIAGAAYVLGNTNGVGLYKAVLNKNEAGEDGTTHFKNNANKAYLPATALTAGSDAPYYSFRFGEGTTGVEKVEMRNEKSEIYDLTGRRVEEITAPGIYIVGGKKVLVK